MNNKNRSNVLLVEILIAILFFMLSATVLVQVFVTSRNLTVRSGVETRALAEAQNVADALYAADDVEALLTDMDFTFSHGAWTRAYEGFTLYVQGGHTQLEGGELWEGSVRGFYMQRNANQQRQQDEEMFELPCARYEGVQS
jgi:hypothetical protein